MSLVLGVSGIRWDLDGVGDFFDRVVLCQLVGLFGNGKFVFEDVPLVVLQEDVFFGQFDDRVGDNRDFTTTARHINDVMGDCKTGGVPTQGFDDFQTGFNGRSEVVGPLDVVGLENIVGLYTHGQ